MVVVCSPFLGGVLYRGLAKVLDLFGAPDDRVLFSASELQTGTEVMLSLGFYIVAVGICIACVRFVLELLNLADASQLTLGMGQEAKLAWGAVAAGALLAAAALLPGALISLFFDYYQSPVLERIDQTLDQIWQAARLLTICALITPLFAEIKFLDVVGWGRVRWGWVNKLALALIVAGIISLVPFFWSPWMPFDDVAGDFVRAGFILLALGIVPQIFGNRWP